MKSLKYGLKTIFINGIIVLLLASCAGGGPPHARVHATFYYPFGYFYYPSVGVYFQYSTGYYFYPSARGWVKTRVLPPHIHLSPTDRIRLNIESDKPYLYHDKHRQLYQPRPNYRPAPQQDKNERKSNQKYYQEREEYKKEKLLKKKKRRDY